jgi:hypothetical protein
MKSTQRPVRYRSRTTNCEWPSRRAARTSSTQARKHDRQLFFRIVEQLKLRMPPSRPVVVLAGRQLAARDGDCGIVRGQFQIRVSRNLNEPAAIDVLIHEWAHALSREVCVGKVAHSRSISDYEFDRLAHGPKWGLAYSKVYRCVTGTIMPQLTCEGRNAEVLHRKGGRRRRLTEQPVAAPPPSLTTACSTPITSGPTFCPVPLRPRSPTASMPASSECGSASTRPTSASRSTSGCGRRSRLGSRRSLSTTRQQRNLPHETP